MATLFNRTFEYINVSGGAYSAGVYSKGSVERVSVRGTIQTQTAKQCLMSSDGTRTTGYVTIFSSDELQFRTQGSNVGGYVVFNGKTYEIISEKPNTNNIINHYEYVGCMCKDSEIPSEVQNV